MNFGGICIETDNAPRLAEFYKIVLQEEPFVEGNHYGFGNIAVYDPGRVTVAKDKIFGYNALPQIWMRNTSGCCRKSPALR